MAERGSRTWRWYAALLLPLLAGCSAPALVYERLDWLANWRLRGYVDLHDMQERAYSSWFHGAWDWHRREELPRYAADLNALAADLQDRVDPAEIRHWQRSGEAHWDRLVRGVVPGACPLLAGLSDAQVESVLARLDRNLAEDREDYDASETKLRDRAQTRLLDQLEDWVGRLEPAQREAAVAWSRVRPLGHETWLARRAAWREAFAAQLRQRGDAGFCTRVERLFLRAPADGGLHRPDDALATAWRAFLTDFHATLTPRQREHLQARVRKLRVDLLELSAGPT